MYFPCLPSNTLSNMASSHPNSCWEALTFHLNSPNQSEDQRTFYTRALDYLDALDIEPDQADDNHKGWKHIKVMFEGEDRQALQILIDNHTITPEDMKKPRATLDATGTTIKSEEHFEPIGTNLSPTLSSNLVREYVCCSSASLKSSPLQVYPPWSPGDAEDNSTPIHCLIPWVQGLHMAARTVPTHLPVPTLPL